MSKFDGRRFLEEALIFPIRVYRKIHPIFFDLQNIKKVTFTNFFKFIVSDGEYLSFKESKLME